MAIELNTGALEFAIKLTDGSVVDWQTDLVEIKLVTEQVEKASNLPQHDGMMIPTAEFLRELTKVYAEVGCPIEDVTVAKSIWNVVNAKFNSYFVDLETQVAKAVQE